MKPILKRRTEVTIETYEITTITVSPAGGASLRSELEIPVSHSVSRSDGSSTPAASLPQALTAAVLPKNKA